MEIAGSVVICACRFFWLIKHARPTRSRICLNIKKSLRLEELHSYFSAEELSEQMYTDGRKREIKEISAKPYRLVEEALHGIFIFLPSIFPGATR